MKKLPIIAAFILGIGLAAGWYAFKNMGKSTTPIIIKREAPTMLPAPDASSGIADFRSAAKRILPSVVSIDTVIEGETWFGERFTQNYGQGSGVVVSKNGYIVTNNHVVVDDRGQSVSKVVVTFADNSTAEAKIIGRDPRSDLAVIKVEKQTVTAIEFADSSKLEVGQWVLAAGNPLGYENTISVGVISNIGRMIPNEQAVFVDGIQTDAAINQGNSGGALTDASGRLIGINVAIATPNQGSVGIGFAIPSNRVEAVMNEIIKTGRVQYGYLGLTIHQQTNLLSEEPARREIAQIVGSNSLPPAEGVLIGDVDRNSPAELGGLSPLDIITKLDGKNVKELLDFNVFFSNKKPGEKVSVTYWSQGQTKTAEITLVSADTF